MSTLTEMMVRWAFEDAPMTVRLSDGTARRQSVTPVWRVAMSTAVAELRVQSDDGITFDRVTLVRDGVDVETIDVGRTVVPAGGSWSATLTFAVPDLTGGA